MTGFASLFAVEARTMWRTWHRYALPVVLVFLAALSVALSRFAPELFKALAGEGFQIELPEPSPDQSYAQWAKNLTQTGVFLVIFSGAGATSALISSGRAQLLAVRPVSRAAQPVAAFLARALVVGSSCLAGAAVVWVGTFAAYSEAPAWEAEYAERTISERKLRKVRRDVAHRADVEETGRSEAGRHGRALKEKIEAELEERARAKARRQDGGGPEASE